VSLLFVEFLDLNMLSGLVDCTFLALCVTFLDLAMNGFPMFGCAVLAKPPFLELALVLALAVDELRSKSEHACLNVLDTYFLMKLCFASIWAMMLRSVPILRSLEE
jgi:hypothetical protein